MIWGALRTGSVLNNACSLYLTYCALIKAAFSLFDSRSLLPQAHPGPLSAIPPGSASPRELQVSLVGGLVLCHVHAHIPWRTRARHRRARAFARTRARLRARGCSQRGCAQVRASAQRWRGRHVSVFGLGMSVFKKLPIFIETEN